MRFLLSVSFPVEKFNQMVRDGVADKTIARILEDAKPEAAYFFANDQKLADRLLAAAAAAGERLWQLPLIDEYREHLKSEVADLNNVGPRGGGAITAGLFLREFAGDRAWAHLDIAGPAFIEKDHPLAPKGATGAAVRTILAYLMADGRG